MIINRNGDKIYRDPVTGKEYLLMLCTTLGRELHYDIITIFEHSEDEPIGEYVDHFFGATLCMNDDAQLDKEITNRLVFKGLTAKIGKPQAFYTGGGIWLSAMYIDATRYAVVDSEDRTSMCIYDRAGEEDDELFPCQNMTEEKTLATMTAEEANVYALLLNAFAKRGVI